MKLLAFGDCDDEDDIDEDGDRHANDEDETPPSSATVSQTRKSNQRATTQVVREQGIIVSLKAGFGFLRCVDREDDFPEQFFPFGEVFLQDDQEDEDVDDDADGGKKRSNPSNDEDMLRKLKVGSEVEFELVNDRQKVFWLCFDFVSLLMIIVFLISSTLQHFIPPHNLHTAQTRAIRVSLLPQGTIQLESVQPDELMGVVEQCLHATATSLYPSSSTSASSSSASSSNKGWRRGNSSSSGVNAEWTHTVNGVLSFLDSDGQKQLYVVSFCIIYF